MSEDKIKTSGSCCSKTVNDFVSGRTNGIFLYLLLRKTISSKWIAQKSLYFFHIFLLWHDWRRWAGPHRLPLATLMATIIPRSFCKPRRQDWIRRHPANILFHRLFRPTPFSCFLDTGVAGLYSAPQ